MAIRLIFLFHCLTLNLLVPGLGFALAGFYGRATLVQAMVWLVIAIMCWTRWILEPNGVLFTIGIIAAVHIASTAHLVTCVLNQSSFRLRNLAGAMTFIAVTLAFAYGGFITKDRWLGIHVFHIPSHSMAPTLLPGDFILADTWCYTQQHPYKGDVAVFSMPNSRSFAVKRIENVVQGPAGETSYFMVGDNRAQSADSRNFGAITHSALVGPVSMVLFPLHRFSGEISRCWRTMP